MQNRNSGCMAKASGNELERLILCAKNSAKISDDVFLDHLSQSKFEDSAILPILSNDILHTIDFGPPVGNDMKTAGKISALNALSDIYAMGGNPCFASVILQLSKSLTDKDKTDLLTGLFYTCNNENVKIVGGHTTIGIETTLGLSVIGKPGKRIINKDGCLTDDLIMISKPIGTGIIFRANYNDLIEQSLYQKAIEVALISNKIGNKLSNYPFVHAMTDVTGFGLIGHLTEMIGANKGAKLSLDLIPIINGTAEINAGNILDATIRNNMYYAANLHRIVHNLDSTETAVLFDPQTNGPLMICIDPTYQHEAENLGFTKIGIITDNPKIIIM